MSSFSVDPLRAPTTYCPITILSPIHLTSQPASLILLPTQDCYTQDCNAVGITDKLAPGKFIQA